MDETVNISYAGKVNVINGNSPRNLYEHQIEAIEKMSLLDKEDMFSTLLVLPTGERVIIVMGAVYVIKSRVSGTLNKYISCIA